MPKVIDNVEICGVQINTKKGQIGVLSVYRPPNTNATAFQSIFEKIVKTARKNCKDIIIGMDHNLRPVKVAHSRTDKFICGENVGPGVTASYNTPYSNYKKHSNS